MIPASFEYHRAASVDEALQLLQTHGDDAKLLAGGHSLLPTMKLRLATPALLIDIGRLADLKYIREDGDTLALGAATTHQMVAESAAVQSGVPLLAEAAEQIGDLQVRNRGTLGGSLAHADPAADYPAAILACGATLVVRGPAGERHIPAADFFLGFFTTALAEDEVLTEVRIPKLGANTGSAYHKFAQPASRYALVGCAAIITVSGGLCRDVRVGFTGVSGGPFLDAAVADALTGRPPNAEAIAAAATHAARTADALTDLHASPDYRKHLAQVCARHALTAAAEAAG